MLSEDFTAKVGGALRGKPVEKPKAENQPFKEMNSDDFKAMFRSYWNFMGELTRKEFYPAPY